MAVRAIGVMLLSLGVVLGHCAAQPKAKPKAKPKAAAKKQREFSRVVVVGTIGEGREPERRQFFQQPFPGYRVFYTVKLKGGEWRLGLDEAGEKLLQRNVGKQVRITGAFSGDAIRVKTINGLTVD